MFVRPPLKQIRTAAARFLATQPRALAPAQLTELLALCGADLIRRFTLPLEDAQDIAMTAWAELAGKESRCRFDLALSTPHLVFLVDELTGQRRPVPVVDLLRILGPREVVNAQPPGPRSAA